MPNLGAASFLRVTADQVVSTKPVLLYGVVILTSVTGGDATLYNGVDAGAGRHIIRLEGTANVSKPVNFPKGLLCDRGLFVDVGSNVTEVVVIYEPYSAPPESLPEGS
jgi:hypothetical protein